MLSRAIFLDQFVLVAGALFLGRFLPKRGDLDQRENVYSAPKVISPSLTTVKKISNAFVLETIFLRCFVGG